MRRDSADISKHFVEEADSRLTETEFGNFIPEKIEASKRRTRTCSAVMIAQRHPRYRAVGTTYEYAKAPPCVRCLRLPCNSRVQWEQHLVLGIMNSVRQELVGVTVSSGLLKLFAHSD